MLSTKSDYQCSAKKACSLITKSHFFMMLLLCIFSHFHHLFALSLKSERHCVSSNYIQLPITDTKGPFFIFLCLRKLLIIQNLRIKILICGCLEWYLSKIRSWVRSCKTLAGSIDDYSGKVLSYQFWTADAISMSILIK